MDDASFDRFGPALPASPIVISVPHAGRDYPLPLRAALRVPLASLVALEDRHVDAVALGAHIDETLLIQRRARAWIDLNRSEDDRDPKVDEGAPRPTTQSIKVRNGLGLIPRRAGAGGDLWSRRFSDAEVSARIVTDHRRYHAAIADALAAAHARFGVAVLVDIHSMPPLAPPATAQIVFGDRFGLSASARFVHRLEGEAVAAGLASALNTPYAGGHILDRHARRSADIHAVQLEIDRSLYLDVALDLPGAGFADIVGLVRRMLTALVDEALATPLALAAE